MFALINDINIVVDISPTTFDVADALRWVACGEDVSVGDSEQGGVFTPAPTGITKGILEAAVNNEFSARVRLGLPYDGRIFSITPDDRNEIAGILEGARNGEMLFGTPWTGMDAPNILDVENGAYAIADLDALVSWATALFALAAPLYTVWYSKKTEVRALVTQAEIDAYDVEAGWPT